MSVCLECVKTERLITSQRMSSHPKSCFKTTYLYCRIHLLSSNCTVDTDFEIAAKKNEKNNQTERLIPLYRAGQRELYQPGRLLNMPEYHPMAANRSAATWPSSTWCPTMVVSLFNSSL